jgi:hypothetical protein
MATPILWCNSVKKSSINLLISYERNSIS